VAYRIGGVSDESGERPPRGGETRTVETVRATSQSPSSLKPTAYRSLEGITNTSQRLLEKGKTYRILDKSQDSQTVIKLVEQLQRAILIYQVGFE
jgi:hypothetical protein